jgi:hypothetical protein
MPTSVFGQTGPTSPTPQRRYAAPHVVALSGAILLPVLISVAVQWALEAQSEVAKVEQEALSRARRLSTLADLQFERALGAAAALVPTATRNPEDWTQALGEATRVVSQNHVWLGAVIWDTRRNIEVVDTTRSAKM